MNTQLKSNGFPVCFLLALALLLWMPGCGKNESKTPDQPQPESGAPSTSGLESGERTSFDEVTSHLDPGGSLYGYLATDQWLGDLSAKVEGWREVILALPGIESSKREQYAKSFDFVTQLIANCGVEEISGVGVSGIALEPGLYQTKVFVHHNRGDDKGYLWSIAGTQPRPLDELDGLPADTAWASFGSSDLAKVWGILKREVRQAGMTEANAGLGELDKQIEKATGSDLATLLGTLGGRQGIMLTLDSARTVQVPLPGNDPIQIPDPALLIAVKVNDDTLFDLIDEALKSNPQVIRSDENGLRCLSMQVPAPLPITLLPTVARYGDYLFVASNDEVIQSVVSVHKGESAGLKSSPEFGHLAKGMPTEGNNFTFVSERLGRVVNDVRQRAMSAAIQSSSGNDAPLELLRKLYASGNLVSSYTIGSITEEGWLRVGHGNQEPTMAVLAPMVIAPAALMAAATLPAMAKARDKAKSISCVNNLKQVGLAARMWSMDHNDTFPPDFIAMKEELATPRVLFCPADKGAPDSKSMTWEDLDVNSISYIFVSPGLSVTNPDVTNMALGRCPIHGHTVFGDGRVERGDLTGHR